MKDEKELKPASMRVRDAAEALLTNILEQVCLVYVIYGYLYASITLNRLSEITFYL